MYEEDVRDAERLLPPEYCVVKVEMLKNLDAPADLADRLKLAESAYHQLAEEMAQLKERFNIRD